ncbi:hypothetical protein RG677_002597 [Vibrio parahaemolyticus]|uniref:hypothetical protein n=1 Tax=Vibrio parahaemolyticus TaxID=670 RepID=UPI001299524F|nr:hypothetical protein [Vibrio parahaemolyticus]EJB8572641.1 hypothetical protein [Vibrio parahaemolyticus]ELB2951150.1 hypothetical protein [Vibrio parahaemolyticus]MCZ6379662.1 hypothetical protein [Vibrio parahaemolyticus]MRD94539.1 hypothetical protein [Vibrio parahaemolyticus]
MENYKYIVDALSSTAAFIAILTVLISWYKNAQPALRIERVVVHKRQSHSDYIIVVRNRKSYPVTINSISCYKKLSYMVEKENGQPPEYREALSESDRVFSKNEVLEFAANGHTDIRIKGGVVTEDISKLLFSAQTSHGYHRQVCKDILTVNMTGKTKVMGMEVMFNTESKLKAKVKYAWLGLCNMCARKS